MKKRGKPRSSAAVTWLLLLALFGSWLLSMGLLTVVLAQEVYDRLYSLSYDFQENVRLAGDLDQFFDADSDLYNYHHQHPDYFEYQMLRTIAYGNGASLHSGGSYTSSPGLARDKLLRSVLYEADTATLVYDGQGELLHSSGEDILYFSYLTQEEWDAGLDSAGGTHYGWIDFSVGKGAENHGDDPYLRFRTAYAGNHRLFEETVIRVSGYFEGTELIPVTMHYITDTQVWQAIEGDPQFSIGEDSYHYFISDVARTGKLEWQLQFDHSADYPGQELVTVYLDSTKLYDFEDTPLTYGGAEYPSLAALVESMDFPAWGRVYQHSPIFQGAGIYELDELLVFSGRSYADYGAAHAAGVEATPEYILVTAIRTNPLRCAMSALRNIYIITFLLVGVLYLWLRAVLCRNLIEPVQAVNEHIAEGWTFIQQYRHVPPKWAEGAELVSHYDQTNDILRARAKEITRLQTALNYAKTAEEDRRRMTSNIAHELKTPLAIIHSYAEGLKEHIAEDKREKYLDTILAEAERTDGMVLEMLDLSRLEAGKVKLSLGQFDLVALTRATLERLELAAGEKELHLTCQMPDSHMVTADEGRLGQVIENFASNAVKYTPAGGNIHVSIFQDSSGTTFAIANDAPPFTREELEKVWDAFYRTDKSRSGSGTGLGLTIAKSIVELHGGRCAVRNTSTGVEFSFRI